MTTIIVAGTICVVSAAANIRTEIIDAYFGLLCVFTIAVGSRMTIQIPRFKSHISVSDIFIFLALLLYGGEVAIVLAACEAAASAWRFCNRKLTVFFNAATMAVSTSSVVLALKVFGLYDSISPYGKVQHPESLIIALSVIVLTQFIVNTALASIHDALKDQMPLWETWKNKYIWTFFSYFFGAISAGLLVQLATFVGLEIILATFPVIFFVYLTYRMYLKNIEISIQQAEQAEKSAKIMETQSEALRESEERFRSAFNYAPIGIGLVAPSGKWLKVNRALTEILGYSEEDFLATDFQSITKGEDLGLKLVRIHELLSGKIQSCQMEQRYIHKSGKTVWTLWSVSAANDARQAQPNLIFQIQDITDKKCTEEQLQYEATHDALTGLPNRPYFTNRLAAAIGRTKTLDDYKVSVLFIDLDRFKYVNDSLGHLIGDELLKEIAVRLKDCMRPADIVARLGGDEFTILVEGMDDTSEVTRIAERIQHKFEIPFELREHEVYSSASIGILHVTEKHRTPEDVMRDADTAMYQAKRTGKARHAVFDDQMHNAAKETLRLETDLRRALEREEIQVYYQPIYSLKSGKIRCFESLARWDHPEMGTIPPTKFIPLAEEVGLIDRLSEQVLRQAIRDIGSLQNRHTDEREYSVSVNLSCRQFEQGTLVQCIQNILDDTGFCGRNLKLEITESVFFEHQERAVSMLNQLRAQGVEIDIDDFGTGYSNLGYLKRLPISSLKIDRSFVSMIQTDGQNDEIVCAIITLARNLGLAVVAEGVETNAQLEALKRLGCECAQGFLLAEPMRFAELRKFLLQENGTDMPPQEFDDVSTITLIQ